MLGGLVSFLQPLLLIRKDLPLDLFNEKLKPLSFRSKAFQLVN